MRVISFRYVGHSLELVWADESTSLFPCIWLRDNDPGDLHPQTRERLFDLTTVDIGVEPEACSLTSQSLVIKWPDKCDDSSYRFDWLAAHAPGRRRPDAARVEQSWWDASDELPSVRAKDCAEPAGLLRALKQLKRHGLIVVQGLGTQIEAGERFGDVIGFKRTSNFGTMFEVVSKADPNNLAYTNIDLPLHTDLPNQALIPGYQFLHCVRNDAKGGESVFADGFRICEAFRRSEPEYFQRLSETDIPFRFHDEHYDIRSRRQVIALTPDGQFEALAFNAHIADVPDLPAEELRDWYAAYQALMKTIRDPQFAQHFRLSSGEMVVFDNRRVLHGRKAFDVATGGRHLRGYYIDANEVDSTMRVLARGESTG